MRPSTRALPAALSALMFVGCGGAPAAAPIAATPEPTLRVAERPATNSLPSPAAARSEEADTKAESESASTKPIEVAAVADVAPAASGDLLSAPVEEAPRREPVEVAQAAKPAVSVKPASAAPGKPFEFAPDAAGKLAAERLPTPRQVTIPNVPWVTSPLPAPAFRADSVSPALSPLPEAPSTAESRALPAETRPIVQTLPTLDRPPLPELSASLAPASVEYPPAGRSRGLSRPISSTLALGVTATLFDPKPVAQDDPFAAIANRALLSLLPTTEPVAIAPEKLSVPDPFEHLRVVELKTPPAEAIAPSASRERPAMVVFEVAP